MGNFGASEIFVIAVLALIVFGPKRLPEIARAAGKAMREFKRATSEITDELRDFDLEEPRKYPEPGPPGKYPEPGP